MIKFFLSCLLFISVAHSAVVNPSVSVENDQVRLHDLFSDIGNTHENPVILDAPLPGKKIVLSAQELRQLNRQYKLGIVSISAQTTLPIKRASRTVSREVVLHHIQEALMDDIPEGHFLVTLDRNPPTLHIALHDPDDLIITDIRIQKNRFTAHMHPVNWPAQKVVVGGRVSSLVSVPVLNRTIHAHERINVQDIEWKEVELRKVNRSTITDENQLIGTSPRNRPIVAGRPLKNSDIYRPHLIKRGAHVHMTYKNGTVFIQGTGKAMQHGAMGDIIRIQNPMSKKIIPGVVTGINTVEVGS